MGSSLFKSLYPEETAKVALLNIGSEEIKGNEVIKETYKKLNQVENLDLEYRFKKCSIKESLFLDISLNASQNITPFHLATKGRLCKKV